MLTLDILQLFANPGPTLSGVASQSPARGAASDFGEWPPQSESCLQSPAASDLSVSSSLDSRRLLAQPTGGEAAIQPGGRFPGAILPALASRQTAKALPVGDDASGSLARGGADSMSQTVHGRVASVSPVGQRSLDRPAALSASRYIAVKLPQQPSASEFQLGQPNDYIEYQPARRRPEYKSESSQPSSSPSPLDDGSSKSQHRAWASFGFGASEEEAKALHTPRVFPGCSPPTPGDFSDAGSVESAEFYTGGLSSQGVDALIRENVALEMVGLRTLWVEASEEAQTELFAFMSMWADVAEEVSRESPNRWTAVPLGKTHISRAPYAWRVQERSAAIDIQRCWRGQLGRLLVAYRRRLCGGAATTIQRVQRGRAGRAYARSFRRCREAEARAQHRSEVALARRRMISLEARRAQEKVVKEIRARLARIAAAKAVQRHWRGHRVRAAFAAVGATANEVVATEAATSKGQIATDAAARMAVLFEPDAVRIKAESAEDSGEWEGERNDEQRASTEKDWAAAVTIWRQAQNADSGCMPSSRDGGDERRGTTKSAVSEAWEGELDNEVRARKEKDRAAGDGGDARLGRAKSAASEAWEGELDDEVREKHSAAAAAMWRHAYNEDSGVTRSSPDGSDARPQTAKSAVSEAWDGDLDHEVRAGKEEDWAAAAAMWRQAHNAYSGGMSSSRYGGDARLGSKKFAGSEAWEGEAVHEVQTGKAKDSAAAAM